MARGQKKSVDEKIAVKERMIESLKTRIKAEQSELEELYREKREEELSGLNNMLREAGMNVEEAAEVFREYLASKEN